jgi:hypothetical protein
VRRTLIGFHAKRVEHAEDLWVFQIGVGIEQPFDLHLQFDEAERTIVEYRDLDRDFLLNRGQEIAHQHR